MREFFRGWRRKIGCVTLVMACVFMGMWMRSFHTRDLLQIRVSAKTAYVFVSSSGMLTWQSMHSPDAPQNYLTTLDLWNDAIVDTVFERVAGKPVDYSHYRCFRTNGTDSNLFHRTPLRAWRAPYWTFVLPLTLLSAYLILWKPRKRVKQDA